MAAYLELPEAIERLEAYEAPPASIARVTHADLRAASDYLDSLAPFYGEKPEEQARQFPRVDAELDENEEPIIPDAILDYVCLRAMHVAADEEPAVISESAGRTSATYAYPKISQTRRRMQYLLQPYLRRTVSY
jgi:hypothetical protein